MSIKKKVNKIYLKLCRFFHWQPIYGMPMELFIEPTNTCNLKCPLCPTGSGRLKVPQGKMSYELFKKVVDELYPFLFSAQLWGFGEPLMHPKIFNMIEYLNQRNVQTQISSNASFLTEKNITRLISSGLTKLRISLDGATQTTYGKYRKTGDIQKVFLALKKINEIKKAKQTSLPKVKIQFIVFKHNEHEIAEMKKIAKQYNVQLKLKPAAVGEKERSMLPKSSNISRYNTNEQKLSSKFKQPKTCPFAWEVVSINWDGTIVSCCKDPHRNHLMGKTDEHTSVREIWLSKSFISFRKTFLKNRYQLTRCKKCVLPPI